MPRQEDLYTDALLENPERRRFLESLGAGILTATVAGTGLLGCGKPEPLLRIASNVFPGYELLHLAAARNYFDTASVRMLSLPSATACMQALAAGNIEGAALTLDEVLSARAENMPLKVVAVLDVSLGADVLLARPAIASLADLKGKRIGVEQSAVGAVMLDAVLNAAGLVGQDVTLVYATVDDHQNLYTRNEVDALVTFEPVASRLKATGAIQLFDSSMVPGRIIDVLAVRPNVVETSPHALRQLVAGHFQALNEFRSNPASAAETIAQRMSIAPADVPAAFSGLDLPDAAQNREWLGGATPRLATVAAELQRVMRRAGLLRNEVPLAGMIDDRFLG